KLTFFGTRVINQGLFRVKVKTNAVGFYFAPALVENRFLGIGICRIHDAIGIHLVRFIVQNDEPGLDAHIAIMNFRLVVQVYFLLLKILFNARFGLMFDIIFKESLRFFQGILCCTVLQKDVSEGGDEQAVLFSRNEMIFVLSGNSGGRNRVDILGGSRSGIK